MKVFSSKKCGKSDVIWKDSQYFSVSSDTTGEVPIWKAAVQDKTLRGRKQYGDVQQLKACFENSYFLVRVLVWYNRRFVEKTLRGSISRFVAFTILFLIFIGQNSSFAKEYWKESWLYYMVYEELSKKGIYINFFQSWEKCTRSQVSTESVHL